MRLEEIISTLKALHPNGFIIRSAAPLEWVRTFDVDGQICKGVDRMLACIDIVYHGQKAERLGRPFDCFVKYHVISKGKVFRSNFCTYDDIVNMPYKAPRWVRYPVSIVEYMREVDRSANVK